MIEINKKKDIKLQFEKEGFSYPILKSNKNYGIRGTTQLDAKTLLEAENKILNHLSNEGLILIKEV